MFTTFLALFAFVAAANAGAILVPETKIEAFPVSKTTITGPSGEIKQEEHLPVVSHETTFVEPPVVPIVYPEIHHEEVIEHEEPLVRLVEPTVRLVKPIVREESLVRLVKPIVHEEPLVRVVKPITHEESLVRWVKPVEHRRLLVKTYPFENTHFRSIYGDYYY